MNEKSGDKGSYYFFTSESHVAIHGETEKQNNKNNKFLSYGIPSNNTCYLSGMS